MATVNLSLTIPDALVPRVVAALRGTYPDVTNGLGDGAALKAVIRQLLRRLVIDWEGQQATGDAMAYVATTRDNAVNQATTDTDAIT